MTQLLPAYHNEMGQILRRGDSVIYIGNSHGRKTARMGVFTGVGRYGSSLRVRVDDVDRGPVRVYDEKIRRWIKSDQRRKGYALLATNQVFKLAV